MKKVILIAVVLLLSIFFFACDDEQTDVYIAPNEEASSLNEADTSDKGSEATSEVTDTEGSSDTQGNNSGWTGFY